MQIAHLCYELYKIDWEQEHKITPTRKIANVFDYYEGLVDDDETYTYKDYLDEFGYDGETYACYDEFLDNEYLDSDYMCSLLRGHTKLIKMYYKDVEEFL